MNCYSRIEEVYILLIYFTIAFIPREYRSTINDPLPRGWLYSSVYLSIVCFGNGKVMGSNSD